jgi:alpha-D-ribose 1-methylphosphonate 5-triphosphate diphosphatase
MDIDSFAIANAKIVLPDSVIEGWLEVEDGMIADFGVGAHAGAAFDFGGDYLLPGLVELHTDHLEAHIEPRPKVNWDAKAAVLAYDSQIVASGITSVFDSLRVGALTHRDNVSKALHGLGAAIEDLKQAGLLRADHLTHLRCEIATPDVVDEATAYMANRPAQLISLMDHTPGQRQFRDLEKMRTYYQRHGLTSEEDFATFVDERIEMHDRYARCHRMELVKLAHRHGAALASHDDSTLDQVSQAIIDRVSIAEFPTTLEAAEASRVADIKVMMGAPNLVRGGSHSGNIAAEDLARAGALEIMSSDYVPASLLMAAFDMPRRVESVSLPQSVAMVTRNPARATGLDDRGEIARGLRADLIRVASHERTASVRRVWRAGARVF